MINVLNRHHGTVRPNHTVSIMRPSALGNPYSHLNIPGTIKVATRDEACDSYKPWLRDQFAIRGPAYYELIRLAKIEIQYGELNLLCCCKPKRCHGDFVKKAIEGIIAEMRKGKHARENGSSS